MSNPSLRARAKSLKRELKALAYAYRDPRTPTKARILGGFVVAYALSPIDLIPDFIPFFGLLDDVILVPLGIAAVIRMIPSEVMEDARAKAEQDHTRRPWQSFVVAGAICLLWLAIALFVWRLFSHPRH